MILTLEEIDHVTIDFSENEKDLIPIIPLVW